MWGLATPKSKVRRPKAVKAIAPTPLTELPALNSSEIDPIIRRMAALLEDF
ncbi:hypothetical protein H6G97_47990 [Nostoc flagelliforme FACHB-838]|uniref:Transposase n=1 Tax=Nostoc flagelliforme FACHB-838 TaxID=2692904 RepID=A0ABR8E4N8_9NOSO|nr:hypothetical protein [Nostoc flagelliforme FACHB-838]